MEMNPSIRLSRAEYPLSSESLIDVQVDGPTDLATSKMPPRRRLSGDVCAIFVHAGAGYHSFQNEKIHLAACEEYDDSYPILRSYWRGFRDTSLPSSIVRYIPLILT